MKGNLDRFYDFFNDSGSDRLHGLNSSYFYDLTDKEREEAWNFLIDRFSFSVERVVGMILLDKFRAVNMFKQALSSPMQRVEYPAAQKEIEVAHVLMLKHVNSVEPDEKYLDALIEFANSEFEDVRAEFAYSLPEHKITPESVDALKRMIFTEVERLPHAAAVSKFMLIHGLSREVDASVYKEIYRTLRLGSNDEKISAIRKLERLQEPDLI